ncbi:MAG: PepSY-like domain-containing protein [Gemmatimonadota bacterium]
MKRLAIVAILLAASSGRIAAQKVADAAVPPTVKQAMTAKFSGTTAPVWTLRSDKSYVAEFRRNGAQVRAAFTASGEWRETSTEIGAITMPEPVRTAVVKTYRGYRFAETRRIDRAGTPATLFEVRLESPGETVTVRFNPNGSVVSSGTKAAPPISLAGTWRGTSLCLPGHPACHDEVVIYRVTAAPSDSTGYDVQADKIVDGKNEDMGKLACSFDRHTPALVCAMPQGVWKFLYRNDSLIGGLIATDGSPIRRVAVRRQKDSPSEN